MGGPNLKAPGFAGGYLLRSITDNVTVWLPPICSAVLAFALLVVLFYAFKDVTVKELQSTEATRGILTYIFAITTAGIAIIIVVGNLLSNGDSKDSEERFRRGKDILTVLIGVFGTIMGFYFGSEIKTEEKKAAIGVAAPSTPEPAGTGEGAAAKQGPAESRQPIAEPDETPAPR